MSLEAIELFHGMSGCVEHLYCWTCAPDGTLLYSNCPDEQPLYTLFTSCGFVEKIRAYARDHDAPYALGTYMGLVWFSVLEKQDRALKKIHLLGPVFHEPVQESEMETFLRDYETLQPVHSAQLLTYMKLSHLKYGLLINFNVPHLKQGIKRFII